MRWLVKTLLGLLVPITVFAWEIPRDDAESKLLYDRLAADWDANPGFKNKDINLHRDGEPSGYLANDDTFVTHAEPVPDEVMKLLPDGKWISFKVFNQAIRGMRQILANFPDGGVRKDLVTIVDYGLKTEARRFFVIDLKRENVLFHTWVHHGRKSDQDLDRYAEQFSNVVDTNKSSVGFMLASDLPYEGMWGYSLRVHGIDGALNSNVHKRAMVIHPWPTIHPRELSQLNAAKQASLGCLSLPYYESGKFYGLDDEPLSKLIIDTVVGRSVIYVSSPQIDLEKRSVYLRPTLLAKETRDAILARVNYDSANQPAFTGAEGDRQVVPEEYKSWRPKR